MKFARTIRLDESDDNVFDHPANAGEWAISGGFEFSKGFIVHEKVYCVAIAICCVEPLAKFFCSEWMFIPRFI